MLWWKIEKRFKNYSCGSPINKSLREILQLILQWNIVHQHSPYCYQVLYDFFIVWIYHKWFCIPLQKFQINLKNVFDIAFSRAIVWIWIVDHFTYTSTNIFCWDNKQKKCMIKFYLFLKNKSDKFIIVLNNINILKLAVQMLCYRIHRKN